MVGVLRQRVGAETKALRRIAGDRECAIVGDAAIYVLCLAVCALPEVYRA